MLRIFLVLGLGNLALALTPDETKILAKHNELRKKVAQGLQQAQGGLLPQASNMNELSWDENVAKVAREWATYLVDSGQFAHNPNRGYLGENLYATTASLNVEDAVQAWFDEVADYPVTSISPYYFSYRTGHFTQVVWAETTKLGCGWADGGDYFSFIVCNYDMPGNIGGFPLYSIGSPGSASGCTDKDKDGLCDAA